ncbi:MAG TPA: LysR substrate-binding domain-containing protein, partial [Telmatospirillum sp.]|nr:LysR substrate-binding domain-containing protein [Telmatospirillum sp.]
VRISAPPTFASVVLAPRLILLKKRHPGIAIDLIGDPQIVNLDRHEADIALRLSRPTGDGLIARKVGEMPFALYAAVGYAEQTDPRNWEFIAHDDIPQELPQQRWLEDAMSGRPVIFRANDVASLAAAARAGMGVALLPHFLGDGDKALSRLPDTGAMPCRDIWMVVHDDLRRAPRIRAVMDMLIEIISDHRHSQMESPHSA